MVISANFDKISIYGQIRGTKKVGNFISDLIVKRMVDKGKFKL